MKNNLNFILYLKIAISTLAAVSLFNAGCTKIKYLPSVSSINAGSGCPSGVGGNPASCCDSTGALINPPTSSVCNTNTPGATGITNHIGSGAAAAGGSAAENQTAQALVGGKSISTQGQSAATASFAPGSALNPVIPPPHLTPTSVLNPNTSRSGPSGGVGGASSANLNGADVSTAPIPEASNSPGVDGLSGSLSGNDAASGAYASNGGILPNGARETGFHYGNGLTGSLSASANPEMGFSGDGTIAPLASVDPSDYFTKINLNENIFKKVEKRYRNKSEQWAR